MSAIGEELITNSIRRWEREVEKWTRILSSRREELQVAALDLARASVMGDPILHLSCQVVEYARFAMRAERTLQAAEQRLEFYRGRLELERG